MATKAQVKTCVYWTASTMTANMVPMVAKSGLLIIDIENTVNNPEVFREIIKINPNTKVLIYINPMEMWDRDISDRPLGQKLKSITPTEFSLKRTDKSPVVFWPNMHMMNLSMHCPVINKVQYNEFYVNWLNSVLTANNIPAHGRFVDNGTATVSWVDARIDADNDGTKDPAAALDNSWKSGMIKLFDLLRKGKDKDFILVSNKAEKSFFFLNNGSMFEDFPNNYLGDTTAGGWYRCMELAKKAGPYTIFQSHPNNLEFVLASSLLLDNVYICLDQNRVIPEEYLINTGKPLGDYYENNGLQCRDYENYLIEVNPENKSARFIKRK
ncbi:MAG: putative glycoside hydrolase [Patescibacteria group bacterium]|nr:putative glycoside hydrolase [Patescibacteria group bacterium]